jgi:hypothetical protein
MKKPKATALALVLALATLGPASALANAGGTDRPVKGAGSGTISLDQAGAFTGEAKGVSGHLGNYTVHLEGTGAPTPEANFFGSGTATAVAANGDEFTGTVTVTTTGPTTTVVVKVTGGTGRFADASGTLTIICRTISLSQAGQLLISEVQCRLTGEISY